MAFLIRRAHINTVFNAEYVITLDELNDVDAIIADLDEKREALEDDEVVLGTEADCVRISHIKIRFKITD